MTFKIENKKTLKSGTYGTTTEEAGFVIPLDPQDDTSGKGKNIFFEKILVFLDCGTSGYRLIIFAMIYLNFGLAILSGFFL